MDRFWKEVDRWMLDAGRQVKMAFSVGQKGVLIFVGIVVLVAAFGYLLGFVRLAWLDHVRATWLGSVLTAFFLLFVVGTVVLALMPG